MTDDLKRLMMRIRVLHMSINRELVDGEYIYFIFNGDGENGVRKDGERKDAIYFGNTEKVTHFLRGYTTALRDMNLTGRDKEERRLKVAKQEQQKEEAIIALLS